MSKKRGGRGGCKKEEVRKVHVRTDISRRKDLFIFLFFCPEIRVINFINIYYI